jgi:glycosyltransferase involved in cell wall biosynthesis
MPDRPLFSLILCTVERIAEPLRFVESVVVQGGQSLELIVVDQNVEDTLERELRRASRGLNVCYIRRPGDPGLSRARNAALSVARGRIIAFPDDDCEYPPGLLDRAAITLAQRNDIDGISCRWLAHWDAMECNSNAPVCLNRHNVWMRARSFTIFLRSELVERLGGFDPRLGLGSGTPFGSGEETDYLLRALEVGAHLVQCPDVAVCHPVVDYSADNVAAKGRNYSRGLTYVLDRHRYSWLFVLAVMLWPLLRALLALFSPPRRRYHWNQFLGRMEAWALLRHERLEARPRMP